MFSLDVLIPELTLLAQYSSKGVLIMVPASSSGTLHGVLGSVRTLLRGAASVRGGGPGEQYVHVDRLLVDLKVGDLSMWVDRAPGGNFIIGESTHLRSIHVFLSVESRIVSLSITI